MNEKKKNYLGVAITVLIVSILLVVITVMGVSSLLSMLAKTPAPETSVQESESTAPPAESEEPETTPPVESEAPIETEPPVAYASVSIPSVQSGNGSLVLVNSEHEFTFPAQDEHILGGAARKTLYGNKTTSYGLSGSGLELNSAAITALNEMMDAFAKESGNYNVLVRSAYRSYDAQMDLYAAYVESYGIEGAERYVAQGGCSDHNTGLGFDLSTYDATTQKAGRLSDDDVYSWIYDHCYAYGIVRRFPADKASITKIEGEADHFRYVGPAHAYYMTKYNLCLEEYVELLKRYTPEGEHLIFSDDAGNKWEIYTVPVSAEDRTEIPVPENSQYSISGNNDGGFVVTLSI